MAKVLDWDEALIGFERFKEAAAKIAAVPKSALEKGKRKRRKRIRKPKANK